MPKKKPDFKQLNNLLDSCAFINKLDSKQINELIQNLENYLEIEKLIIDKEKVITIKLGLGDAYTRIGKFKQAEEFYTQALTASKQMNNINIKIHATNGICIINAIHNNYMKAIEGWRALLEEVEDSNHRADFYNNLGISYSMSDSHREALECQYNCLKIDEDLKREAQIAIDYFNLASTYMKLKQFDKSLELYNKSIYVFESKGELRYLAFAYSNISMVYSDLGKFDKALEYANRSLEIKHKYANELEIANTYAVIGGLYKNQNDYTKALGFYDKAKEIFEKGDDPQSLAGIFVKYGRLYFDNNNMIKAEEYCVKGFDIAAKNSFLQVISEAGKLLSIIYSNKKEYSSAHKYQSQYIDAYIKIFEDNPKILIARSESEYYRIKTEEQAEFYRLSNIELTEKNKIISEQSEMLNYANNNLLKSNSMLKKLLSVIAHDIRGPVSTTAQALSMIKDNEFTKEEADIIIQESAVSLQNTYHLLNDLLTWSSSSQQSTAMKMVPIDINKNIMEDIKIYHSMAKLKSIDLSFVPKRECIVLADKNYLHSIIRNLIHNAIKYTAINGHVSISIRYTKSKAYISITDDGIGLTNAEIRRLMEGKAKVKQGTHFEMGSGFGIGLCLDYLAQMQSNLIVKSTPNHGSQFTIVLKRP